MREQYGPAALLLSRVPVSYLEAIYSMMLPDKSDISAADLLTSIAFIRGFMSSSGIPDSSRAARMLVKDVVNGKILWAAPPPGAEENEFNSHLYSLKKTSENIGAVQLEQMEKRNLLENASVTNKKVDLKYFSDCESAIHVQSPAQSKIKSGPSKKHFNKGAKEKLRRLYGTHDL